MTTILKISDDASCKDCVHFKGVDTPEQDDGPGLPVPDFVCEAYPEGIPAIIQKGEVPHFESYEGDGGITFTPREAAEKGGPGSGNWNHPGEAGVWGGAGSGGGSEEFLKHPGEVRNSFDPETGEFDVERHQDHCGDMTEHEYSQYMAELEEYIESEEGPGKGTITSDLHDKSPQELLMSRKALEEGLQEHSEVTDRDKEQPGEIDRRERADALCENQNLHHEYEYCSLVAERMGGTHWEGDTRALDALKYSRDMEDARQMAEEDGLTPEEFEEILEENVAKYTEGVLHNWARDSVNQRDSYALQRAVQDSDLIPGGEDAVTDHWGNVTVEDGKEYYGEHKEAFQQLAEAQYKETQRVLEEAGIEEVVAYRGMSFEEPPESIEHLDWPDSEDVEGPNAAGDYIDIEAQPASSFSTDPYVARQFAQGPGYEDGGHNVVLGCEIPREQIVSTSFTGAGDYLEDEVIVAGDSYSASTMHGKGMTMPTEQEHIMNFMAEQEQWPEGGLEPEDYDALEGDEGVSPVDVDDEDLDKYQDILDEVMEGEGG